MKAPLLTYFGGPLATKDLKIALKKESSKIQLKGLVGSSFALTASAVIRESSVPHLFIFRDKEEASYFINDIESLLNNEVLFFPASYAAPTAPAPKIILPIPVLLSNPFPTPKAVALPLKAILLFTN